MCTSLRMTAGDGSVVIGRTSEYALPVVWDLLTIPAGTPMAGTAPDGPGRMWTTRHTSVGIAVGETDFGGAVLPAQPTVIDGLNDAGLYASLQYLPHYTEYPTSNGVAPSNLIGPSEAATYALGMCATVDEVLAAFDDLVVWAAVTPVVGTPPLQLVVHDPTGASAVVDWVAGTTRCHLNPLGVATNSPPLDWHLANLGNYVQLSPDGRAPLTIDDLTFPATGEGSGMLGMPGDLTPPSRFVRAAMHAANVRTGADSASMARVTQHILNTFDIPAGMVRVTAHSSGQAAAHGLDEHTVWMVVAELTDGPTYTVRTYDDPTWRRVRVPSMSGGEVGRVPLVDMDLVDAI